MGIAFSIIGIITHTKCQKLTIHYQYENFFCTVASGLIAIVIYDGSLIFCCILYVAKLTHGD